MRHLDHKKRQDEILDLIIREYIESASTVSSEYLKNKYRLPMSSATLRNIMAELEDLGYISHIHTSSGRVPTPEGFRYYVRMLMNPKTLEKTAENIEAYLENFMDKVYSYQDRIEDILAEISKTVSYLTHYISLGVSSGVNKVFYSGMQFILDQPEFEDIRLLRNLFVALEEETSEFLHFVNENLKDKRDIQILIGDDIALDEMQNCALTLSSVNLKRLKQDLILGVLGPIRMDYNRVIGQLQAIKECLEEYL